MALLLATYGTYLLTWKRWTRVGEKARAKENQANLYRQFRARWILLRVNKQRKPTSGGANRRTPITTEHILYLTIGCLGHSSINLSLCSAVQSSVLHPQLSPSQLSFIVEASQYQPGYVGHSDGGAHHLLASALQLLVHETRRDEIRRNETGLGELSTSS